MAVESDFFERKIGTSKIILEKDAQTREKFQNEMLKSFIKSLDEKEKAELKSLQKIKKLREAGLDFSKEQREYEKLIAEKESAEKDLAAAKLAINDEVDRKVQIASFNSFKKMTIRERREYSKNVADKLKTEVELWSIKEVAHKKHIDKLTKDLDSKSDKEKKRLQEQIAAENAAFEASKRQLLEQQKIAEQMSKGFLQSGLGKGIDILKAKTGVNLNVENRREAGEAAGKKANETSKIVVDHYKKQAELQKQIIAAQIKGDKDKVRELKDQQAEQQRLFEESSAYEEAKAAIGEAALESLKEAGAEALDAFARGADNLFASVMSGMQDVDKINKNLNAIYGDQAKYLAKLQGSTEDWRKSVDNVSDAIGFSGIVSKKNVITKMKDLVDSGIAYNIEMRAFLAETSANIASTFEVTNGTLLRMIRLQQQDSTAARLGMEATLTRLFNDYFQDTTYLKDAADQISAAILDASATMNRDQSLEFEYTMQKWLGSLYSLGMSDQAVNTIATGINYLGTGNVSALNSNNALQTLLAMSAARSGGKSYTELLQGGLNSSETNKLLRSMIEYLAEIANSQDNLVTKSAYAELFGMSVTDLSSFASLTTKEIDSLYHNTVSYQDLMNETTTRLSQISKNMSLSDLVDNAIENAEVGAATTIGSNAVTYGTWKALGLLQDYVGEIKIPSVLAAGFGLSSDIDLINVAQTGMVGMGMIGSLLGALGSMVNGGVTNLNNWDFNESTTRGGGLKVLNSGSSYSTSYSAVLGTGNVSADDVESASLTSAQDKAYESSGVTSEDIEEGKEIPKKIYDALAGDSTPNVLSELGILTEATPDVLTQLGILTAATPNVLSELGILTAATPNVLTLLSSINSTETSLQDIVKEYSEKTFDNIVSIESIDSLLLYSSLSSLETQIAILGVAQESKNALDALGGNLGISNYTSIAGNSIATTVSKVSSELDALSGSASAIASNDITPVQGTYANSGVLSNELTSAMSEVIKSSVQTAVQAVVESVLGEVIKSSNEAAVSAAIESVFGSLISNISSTTGVNVKVTNISELL